jgi:hypothetical protein
MSPILEALDSITARGIDTSSWIHYLQVGEYQPQPLSEKDMHDLTCLLGRMRTLRMLGLPRPPTARLLAVPARMCAESMRKLELTLNTAALEEGAIAHINTFQRLRTLLVISVADWAVTPESLVLPHLAITEWDLFRSEGSAHELEFLSRCRFGQLAVFRIYAGIAADWQLLIAEDPQQRLVLGQFLQEHPNIIVAIMNLPFDCWEELMTKMPGVIEVWIQDSECLLPPLATILPRTLRHLHICIDVNVHRDEQPWSFLTQLALYPCRPEALYIHVSFQGGIDFRWDAALAPEPNPLRHAFNTVARLLAHALSLASRNIHVLDHLQRSVTATQHPVPVPLVSEW